MPTESRKSLGRLGEQLAAEHLERLGWRIVERNYQTRFGELDLVAVEDATLVFAEVKTCRVGRGEPWRSLHERKQAQVRKMAGVWFNDRRGIPFFERVRFDAIGVVLDHDGKLVRLDHLEDAF
jgi:putative endonuclease